MCWRKAGGLPGVKATGQGVCCLQRLRANEKGKACMERQGKGGHSRTSQHTAVKDLLKK